MSSSIRRWEEIVPWYVARRKHQGVKPASSLACCEIDPPTCGKAVQRYLWASGGIISAFVDPVCRDFLKKPPREFGDPDYHTVQTLVDFEMPAYLNAALLLAPDEARRSTIDKHLRPLQASAADLQLALRDLKPDQVACGKCFAGVHLIPGPWCKAEEFIRGEIGRAQMWAMPLLYSEIGETQSGPLALPDAVPSEGTGNPPQLRDVHLTILAELAARSVPVRAAALAARSGMPSYNYLCGCLKDLERYGCVNRPHGPKRGYSITSLGRSLLASHGL